MKKATFNTLLVGGGFLLGTAGIKALTSAPAKKAYVHGIACGLRAKNCYQDMLNRRSRSRRSGRRGTYLTSDAKPPRPIPSLPPNKALRHSS